MKLQILVLIFAAASVHGARARSGRCLARNECQLQEDLRDIWNLVNTDDIAMVLVRHLDDPEMQDLFRFIFSQQFRDLYLTIASQPEIVEFLQWLESQCVDIRRIANAIRDYLEIPPVEWRAMVEESAKKSSLAQRGVADFWEDLLDVIPLEEINALATEKYNTSPAFAAFIEQFRSEQTMSLFYQFRENETYQHAVQQLREYGIDVDAIIEFFGSILGW